MTEPGHNVLALLRDVAARVPDRAALVMEDAGGRESSITFSGLWERVDRVSAGLRRRGLQAGDRAIVMIPMSIDLYAALLGLLKMGAVAVFVDPWIGARQIAAFAAFAEPRAFLGIPKSHVLRLLDRRLRRIPITVTTGGRLGPLPARHTLAALEQEAGDGIIHPAAADDSALITFTSGSSGEPKGANRTHGFLLAQHRALAAEFPAQDGEVDMPMFPVFALNNLAVGVTSVVPAMDFRRVESRSTPRRVLRQMKTHGVTTCTASPPFFDRLAEALTGPPGPAAPSAASSPAALPSPTPSSAPGAGPAAARDPRRLRLHRSRARGPPHRRGEARRGQRPPSGQPPATVSATPAARVQAKAIHLGRHCWT